MDWQDEYKKRVCSAQEAVRLVKSGDRVMIPLIKQPWLLPGALLARKDELRNVEVLMSSPLMDWGFAGVGMEPSFTALVELFVGVQLRAASDEKRIDYLPGLFSTQFKPLHESRPDKRDIDVFMTVVTPPNKQGFCNLTGHMWNKRTYVKYARKVIAEVDKGQIVAHGDTWVHVTEIDAFVEHTPDRLSPREIEEYLGKIEAPERRRRMELLLTGFEDGSMRMLVAVFEAMDDKQLDEALGIFGLNEPPDHIKRIGEYVSDLVKDGDCIQIGVGTPAGYLPMMGVFNGKKDLGLHTEMCARGIGRLVRDGVITGARKQLFPHKAVASTWSGCDPVDLNYINENPKFALYDAQFVVNPLTIAQNNNQVSMNNALSVDLTGQINSETVFGPRVYNGHGGQPESHMGAIYSKGGRAITLLPSTALGGSMSRIVPQLEEGSLVTIPRYYADHVVTEYGVARLLGKTCRQRAEELINVAHPDFRAELRKEAKRLLYP